MLTCWPNLTIGGFGPTLIGSRLCHVPTVGGNRLPIRIMYAEWPSGQGLGSSPQMSALCRYVAPVMIWWAIIPKGMHEMSGNGSS